MTLPFKRSEKPTIGVEVEMQIVDRRSRELVPAIFHILEEVPRSLRHRIKPEFIQSTLEINTEICRTVEEIRENLLEHFQLVFRIARRIGVGLLCAGTHPISSWKEQKITPDPRYRRLLQEFQVLGRRLNICGFHVHVGISDGNKATAVLNVLRGYLPYFLALSTSSPFWSGYNTGMYSSRIKVFQVLPTAGLPPRMKNWKEFESLVRILTSTRTIENTREIWWEARPHPVFGTLEVRVCDTPSTLDDMIVITALIHAVVVHLGTLYEKGTLPKIPLRQLVEENKWQAARHGLEGYFIDYRTHRTIGIRDAVRGLVSDLRETSESLGSSTCLNNVEKILKRGTSAHEQLDVFRKTGDLISVVDHLMEKMPQ